MKDHCVPLYLARRLKIAGFKNPCLFGYDKCDMFFKDLHSEREFLGVNYNASGYSCSAPFWQQVTDWFRLEHKLEVGAVCNFNDNTFEYPSYNAYVGHYILSGPYHNYATYGSYEVAMITAIDKGLDKILGIVEKVEYKHTRTI